MLSSFLCRATHTTVCSSYTIEPPTPPWCIMVNGPSCNDPATSVRFARTQWGLIDWPPLATIRRNAAQFNREQWRAAAALLGHYRREAVATTCPVSAPSTSTIYMSAFVTVYSVFLTSIFDLQSCNTDTSLKLFKQRKPHGSNCSKLSDKYEVWVPLVPHLTKSLKGLSYAELKSILQKQIRGNMQCTLQYSRSAVSACERPNDLVCPAPLMPQDMLS